MNKNTKSAFTLIELLVVISIIAILAGIALPAFSQVQVRGKQTKDLSNAKQVYLACKLFATDNNGLYPNMDGQVSPNTAISGNGSGISANEVYACLFPNYLTTEDIFYQAYPGGWCSVVPNNNIATAANILPAGTNNFGYMFGLTDTSNPNYPLIFDAPNTATTQYPTTGKGGLWNGAKAVMVFCDGHGGVMNVDPTSMNVLGNTGQATTADVLTPTSATPAWMSATTNSVLYPN